jgi:hypothetical protein
VHDAEGGGVRYDGEVHGAEGGVVHVAEGGEVLDAEGGELHAV